MEARVENLETSMEYMKKMASQHSAQLVRLEANIVTTEEINTMLKNFRKEKGIPFDDEDDGVRSKIPDSHAPPSGLQKDDKNYRWIKKVELPIFEGIDPIGWIARAEKFFEIQQIDRRYLFLDFFLVIFYLIKFY